MAQIGEISVKITADASDLQRDLEQAQRQLSTFGDTMRSIGSRMGNVFDSMTQSIGRVSERMREVGDRGREMGENMVDMSENLMQGITVPLSLLSAGAVKASLDMSRLASIIKANMAGVKGSIEEVQGVAERVFRAGLGKDAEEVGRTVAMIKREFDNLNATQLENLSMQIHGVAEALGTDAAGVLEDVIELTDKYKITTQQALDLVAAGYDAASLEGKNLNKVLKEVNGTASEMSKTMQNDPTVKWRGNLRQLMETLSPLGDELLRFANEILPKVTSSIKSAVNWFMKQDKATRNLIITVGGLLAILPLITMTLGALIMTGSSVISFFGTLGSWLARAATSVLNFAKNIGKVGGWLKKAGTAVSNFFKNFKNVGTLGRIAGPIGIVVTALTLLYNVSKDFADFVDRSFKGVWESLKNTFNGFSVDTKTLKESFSQLGEAFGKLFDKLEKLWVKIEPIAVAIGKVLVGAIVAALAVINGLLNALSPLINVVINVVAAIVSLASAFVSLLTLDFDGFFESINTFVDSFVNILAGLVDMVIAFFTGLWDTLVQVFAQFGINLNAQAIAIFTSLWNWIVSIGSSIASFFVGLWNGIKTAAITAWNYIKTSISTIWNAIKTTAVTIWNGLKSAIIAIWNGIKSAASNAWNTIKTAVITVVTTVKNKVVSIWNSIKNAISNAMNTVKSKITTAWNGIKNSVSNAMNTIKTSISNGFNSAKNAVSNAVNRIKSILSGLAKSAYTWGSNLASSFAKGLSSKISAAVNAAKNAAAKIKSFLGWSSPTKEGPGKDSDKWAPNLMNMLAAGIQAGIPRLETSVSQAASAISEIQPSNGNTPTTSNTATINIYPQQAVLRPRQLMRELDRARWINGGRFV